MKIVHEYFGYKADDVLELLRRRKVQGYNPRTDADGHKLAPLFEGGAMAGFVSSASGAEIAAMGFKDCFDTIYGTSLGAINAAYFVAPKMPATACAIVSQ